LSHSKNLKLGASVGYVDLREVINNTFGSLNYLAGADKVSREVTVSGCDFYSDQWRIGEIFRNLLSNAIKYRRAYEVNSMVRVDVVVNPETCRILVEDNGIGVDESMVPRIFEMFFRASDRSEGSGLGLYIVKNAVDRLEGTIQVESKIGEGTRFSITLPNLVPK
jgi:signal transduction histidine kinase